MNGGPNMLYKHFTEKPLGLQGVNITNVEEKEGILKIFIKMDRKKHNCICCGTATDTVHDYREQEIKDISISGKQTILVLKKRRYRCPNCGKRFFEKTEFLPKYNRNTTRLVAHIIDKLRDERSFTSVAREVNLSVSTIIRIFDAVSYPKPELPETLSIDEFKGNTWGEKYQCILTDPKNKVVLDILPERYKPYLNRYFKGFSKKQRDKVKYFVSDMWRTYTDISDIWFKNATQIIDKYHWIRQAIWSFEKIRKEEQSKLSPELRKYFKRSKSLLIKRFGSLKEEQKQQVNVMLYYSVNISRAYFYKEKFLELLSLKDLKTAQKALAEWIEYTENCGLLPFEKCAETMRNWYKGIVNSFSISVTNGFTEGCNNKIKVLKRNAYGYRNFKRFRNRILHIFSHQQLHNKQAAA